MVSSSAAMVFITLLSSSVKRNGVRFFTLNPFVNVDCYMLNIYYMPTKANKNMKYFHNSVYYSQGGTMLMTCDYINNKYCTGCYHAGDHLAEWTCILRQCTHAPAAFVTLNQNCSLCTHQADCSQYTGNTPVDLTMNPEACKAYVDLCVEISCIPAAPEHSEALCRDDKDNKNGKLHCKDCGRFYNEDTTDWDVKHKKQLKTNFNLKKMRLNKEE